MGTLDDESEIIFCFGCECELEIVKRKYFGKYFCSYCYQKNFIKITCDTCKNQKRIYKNEQNCQLCLTKIMPCIRCAKTGVRIGMILEMGIVCNSCAYHFRTLRKCDHCGQERKNVRIYTLIDEENRYCYQCVKLNFYETCFVCKNKEFIYCCDLHRQKYCKRCALGEKKCQICCKQIPAGKRANKCDECSYKILFRNRKNTVLQDLEPSVMDLFKCLLDHICVNKGVKDAARAIPYLHLVILNINNHFLQFQKFPSMYVIDSLIKKLKFKHYHFISSFLHGYLSENYEDFQIYQMISRQINKIHKETLHFDEFEKYIVKIQNKPIQLHSKRLAITSAVMILTFAQAMNANSLCQEIVDQFCWLYWGQRASVTGFLNHLNISCNLSLEIKGGEYFKFEPCRESKARLEQQIIDMFMGTKIIDNNILLKKVFAYMHNVELPKDLEKLDLMGTMNIKDKIRLRNLTFALPIIH